MNNVIISTAKLTIARAKAKREELIKSPSNYLEAYCLLKNIEEAEQSIRDEDIKKLKKVTDFIETDLL